jgi:D-aspartate ligase
MMRAGNQSMASEYYHLTELLRFIGIKAFVTKTTPAIVVGAKLPGLGALRSLASGRVRTVVVDTTRVRAGMWSRFGRTVILDALRGPALVDGLLALQDKLRCRPVLIITDEAALTTVSEYRNQLLGAYKFNLPPQHIVTMLQNKARFHEFADQNELPVPRTIVVRADTQLAKLSDLPFPVVVKAAARQASDTGSTIGMRLAATLREAENICREMLESEDEVIVQEWIDGPDSNNCFSLFYLGHNPDYFKVFVGRKLAGHPAKLGKIVLCLAAAEVMDTLEPLIARFLDLAEFRGLGSLEFKWDIRQRRYVIIGPKAGHTEWQQEIATLSGVNLPLAAYRDELGLPPILSTQIDRTIAWRQSAMLRNEMPMLSPGMRVYDGYWRLSDPLPALFAIAYAGYTWTYRHIVKPTSRRAKSSDIASAMVRRYQNLVKAIIHRGKPRVR